MKKSIIIVVAIVIVLIALIAGVVFLSQKPASSNTPGVSWSKSQGKMSWDSAVAACANMGKGWRLPTVRELTVALTDQYVNNNPSGFNDDPAIYWTDNKDIEEQYQASFARVVGYDYFLQKVYPNALGRTVKKTASARCVRYLE